MGISLKWVGAPPDWLKSGVVATSGIVVGSTVYERYRRHLVYQRVKDGWCPTSSTALQSHLFVPRPNAARAIKHILCPKQGSVASLFYYISGAVGGGKTTLVQAVAREIGTGVVYVAAGNRPVQFGSCLADALHVLDPAPGIGKLVIDNVLRLGGLDKSSEVQSQLDVSLESLDRAAARFRHIYRRPVVLIVDDAQRLATQSFWQDLLDAARSWADRGLVRVVFVSSDDGFVQALTEQSRCSKSGSMEIHDLSPEQADVYLARRHVDPVTAQKLIQVAGGRIMELVAAVESLENGEDIADVTRSILAAAEAECQQAGVLDCTPQQEPGVRVLRALLAQGDKGIGNDEWNRLVPDPAHKVALLTGNMLALHERQRCLTFDNQAVKVYVQQKFGGIKEA